MRFAVLAVTLSGCMVFSESMRRSHEDAGAEDASSAGTSSSSSSSGACSLDAPASAGVDGCGGKGGGSFTGGSASGSSLTLGSAMCGTGATELTLAVNAGACVDVFFSSGAATMTVTPPTGGAQRVDGTGDAPFQIAASGGLTIVVSGTGAWKLVAR